MKIYACIFCVTVTAQGSWLGARFMKITFFPKQKCHPLRDGIFYQLQVAQSFYLQADCGY
jgi:hypothetical protein